MNLNKLRENYSDLNNDLLMLDKTKDWISMWLWEELVKEYEREIY